jgi:hypothetical protein
MRIAVFSTTETRGQHLTDIPLEWETNYVCCTDVCVSFEAVLTVEEYVRKLMIKAY